ncbi:cystatin-like [Hyperolius riggenbachi]|uniref:cystatin-like n=1 Tax=Hyperolius riggenbachi TaxID=752182 RepID=UPI0035A32858
MAARLYLLVVVSLLSVFASSDMLVGGPETIDPSDPQVLQAARFALSGFNQQLKEDYKFKLLKVVSAEAQVVAGVIYTVNVDIGKTDCKKDSTSDAQSCSLMQNSNLAQTLSCTFKVLEVPWENVEKVLYASCKAL